MITGWYRLLHINLKWNQQVWYIFFCLCSYIFYSKLWNINLQLLYIFLILKILLYKLYDVTGLIITFFLNYHFFTRQLIKISYVLRTFFQCCFQYVSLNAHQIPINILTCFDVHVQWNKEFNLFCQYVPWRYTSNWHSYFYIYGL